MENATPKQNVNKGTKITAMKPCTQTTLTIPSNCLAQSTVAPGI